MPLGGSRLAHKDVRGTVAPARTSFPRQTSLIVTGCPSRTENISAALPSVIAARYRTIEHCDWRAEEWRYDFKPELARKIVEQNQFVGLTMSGRALSSGSRTLIAARRPSS